MYRKITLPLLLSIPGIASVQADPTWWASQNVKGLIQYNVSPPNASDYSPVTQGQAKVLFARAMGELMCAPTVTPANIASAFTLYGAITSPSASTADFGLLNIGQLKNLRNSALAVTGASPPSAVPGAVASDQSPANLGQLKNAFNFSIGATDWKFPTTGQITTPLTLPLTNYGDPSMVQRRTQLQAREREYKLDVSISNLSKDPFNNFTFDGGSGGHKSTIGALNWGERLNLVVRNALSARLGDVDWQSPGMLIVGAGSGPGATYGSYSLEAVDREINLDVYFDDGAMNLFRQNGSARLRQRFSGASRFYDRLRWYLTGHGDALVENDAHSRLEFQCKLDETELAQPAFANVGDGYSEVSQTRILLQGNGDFKPEYRSRNDLFSILIPAFKAGSVVWPVGNTSYDTQDKSQVARVLYRALKASHATYNTTERELRLIPTAVVIGQRHRQHLLSANGDSSSAGNNTKDALIITTDITYMYDPVTLFKFMRTSAADDALPQALQVSAEIEIQVEDQFWTRHVDNTYSGGSYSAQGLIDYAKLQNDMRKARDIVSLGVSNWAATPPNNTSGLTSISGGIVSKYRKAILAQSGGTNKGNGGRATPALALFDSPGAITLAKNATQTVVPVARDQAGQRIFPNGGWIATVSGGGITVTPAITLDGAAAAGRTILESLSVKTGTTTGSFTVTIRDQNAPAGPAAVLTVNVTN